MLILKDEFQEMLRIVAVSSVEGIGFTDSIAKALNGYSLKELSDEGQRQIIQAWLYPTNDDGEIDPIDDCPNCADQASIAAPGQTTLCKTHNIETSVICSFCESDKAHYAQMKEFFTEEIERIQFKSALPFCSACGTDKRVVYIGLIQTNSSGILNFSFCVDCRDELTLKKNAAIAAQERIGA